MVTLLFVVTEMPLCLASYDLSLQVTIFAYYISMRLAEWVLPYPPLHMMQQLEVHI